MRVAFVGLALAAFVGASIESPAGATSEGCDAVARSFVERPDERSLAALTQRENDACWESIGSSTDRLQKLDASAASGNRFTARYLASHLRQLDGGELEDALSALGQFAETDMERFVGLARDGVLSTTSMCDALVMLPLSSSDDLRARLAEMQKRRVALARVSRRSLKKYKAIALAAIDPFMGRLRHLIRITASSASPTPVHDSGGPALKHRCDARRTWCAGVVGARHAAPLQ